MRGIVTDCHHALRLYRRTPGASLIAVAVLAIAIAFVGSFLSLYVDLVLRPHPGFERSEGLTSMGPTLGGSALGIRYDIVERIADEMASVEAAAPISGSWTLFGQEGVAATAAMVSEEVSVGLRPRVRLGRGFEPADHAPGAEPAVLLTHRFWLQYFGGSRDVLGTTVEISISPSMPYSGPPGSGLFDRFEPEQDSAQFRIVGVLHESLSDFWPGASYWLALEPTWHLFRGVPESLPASTMRTVFRRSPGATVTAVLNEFRARFDTEDSPLTNVPGTDIQAIDGIVVNFDVHRATTRQLEMFLVGSLLLAVVAAANVSLFLLARAPGRRRELGIRVAVGAPIRRIARQLATEAGLLVMAAAVAGLIGSFWLSAFLRGLTFMQDAEWRDVAPLDWRVLGLVSVFLLALALLVSLGPAAGIRRLGIATSSRQSSARASPAQRLAGTAQIAIAGTLASAAIAFAWYIGALTFGDAGYETRDRILVQFSRFMNAQPYSADLTESERIERNAIELRRRHEVILSIPGVDAVAYGEPVPGFSMGTPIPAEVADPFDASRKIDVYANSMGGGFIELLGYRLVHGRAPAGDERGVVLVNQSLARALWGRENVVGERLPGSSRWGAQGVEIIGVLEDLSFQHPAAAVRPHVLTTNGSLTAVVVTRLTAAKLHQALDRLIADGVIDATVNEVQPLTVLRNELIAPDRARGYLTIATAALVVFLAAIGFYGTQRYLVSAGRCEYAIRASLGAGPAALGRLVFTRGLMLSLPGLVLGGLFAFIVVVVLRDDYLSREISPAAVTIAVIAGLVLLLLAASLGPARQARRTQPAPLLRED